MIGGTPRLVAASGFPGVLAHLLARRLLALALLGSEDLLGEILRLEDRAQFAFALAQDLKEALGPVDRLVHGFHLEEGIGGDELLGLRERSVDDGDLAVGEAHPLALPAGVQAVAVEHHAGLGDLLDENPIRSIKSLLGGAPASELASALS